MLGVLQQKKLDRLFQIFDANGNGVLDKDDFDQQFEKTVKLIGWDERHSDYDLLKYKFDKRWEKLSEYADFNKDGIVTKDEFTLYMEDMLDQESEYDKHIANVVNFVFDLLDPSAKGNISEDGLKLLYEAYGIDPDLTTETFPILDLNGDGVISPEEMEVLYKQYHYSNNIGDPGNHFFGKLTD